MTEPAEGGHATPADPRAPHRWDPVRRQTPMLLLRAFLFALAVALFDALIGRINISNLTFGVDVSTWTLGPDARHNFVNQLLTFLGIPVALFITLTSLALPSLSSYANGSLLLQHGRYPLTGRDRLIAALFGRRNPFHDGLQLALFVAVALLGLAALRNFTAWDGHVLADGQIPVLFFLAGCAAVEVFALVYFVFWVIRLRQPTEVIQYLKILAENALAYAHGLAPEQFRRAGPSEIYGRFSCDLEEQEDVKQIALALSQTTLRAVHDHQPFSADEGVTALKRVYELAHGSTYPERWRRMRAVQGQVDNKLVADASSGDASERLTVDWLSQLVLEGLAEVLFAAAERSSALVGAAVAREMGAIVSALFDGADPKDPSDAALVSLAINKIADAFVSCLVLGDRRLRDALLDQLRQVLLQLARARDGKVSTEEQQAKKERAEGWGRQLRQVMRVHGASMANAAVAREDIGGLRAVLDLLDRVSLAHPDLRQVIAEVVLNVGATALALRSDESVSVLAAWVAGSFDERASVVPAAASQLIQSEPEAGGLLPGGDDASDQPLARAAYVSVDYVAVFIALATGRGIQFGHVPWMTAARTLKPMIASAKGMRNAEERCTWVCDRVATVAHFFEDERKGWVAAVRETTKG